LAPVERLSAVYIAEISIGALFSSLGTSSVAPSFIPGMSRTCCEIGGAESQESAGCFSLVLRYDSSVGRFWLRILYIMRPSFDLNRNMATRDQSSPAVP